jgi:hypothetical protein
MSVDCRAEDVEGDAMTVRKLETRLNRRLKKIHRGYAVKNLKRLPNGGYWFDLATAFDARDMAKVNHVFDDLLSQGHGKRRQTV